MARSRSAHPTQLELEVLKVIWPAGRCTVRQVRDELERRGRDLAYTSVMTVMSVMAQKGYLRRHKQGTGFVYSPKVDRHKTLGRMLKDLVDRAFNGSVAAAMLHLLGAGDVNRDELAQIQQIIERKAREEKR